MGLKKKKGEQFDSSGSIHFHGISPLEIRYAVQGLPMKSWNPQKAMGGDKPLSYHKKKVKS